MFLGLLLNPTLHQAAVVAMADAPSVDPVQWLVNYGIAGIVLAMIVTGQLRTKAELTSVQRIADQRLDDLRARDAAIQALMAQITGHTLPQLAQAAQLVEAIPTHNTINEDALLKRLDELARRLEEQTPEGGKR